MLVSWTVARQLAGGLALVAVALVGDSRSRSLPALRAVPRLTVAKLGRRRGAGTIRAARGVLPAPGRGREVLLRRLPRDAAQTARVARLLVGLRPGGRAGRGSSVPPSYS